MCCTWLDGNAGPKKSPKMRHLGTIAELCRAISLQLRHQPHVSTIRKNLLNSSVSLTCPHNMVNFGLPNWICILAALLYDTLVVGVSQTFRHLTEGATYIRHGGHHVGHWPTFLVMVALCNRTDHYIFMLWFLLLSSFFSSPNLSGRRSVCHTSSYGVALV